MNTNTSRLQIENLEFQVFLGWPDKERQHRQLVKVAMDIHFSSPPKACSSDDLKDTFCYATIIAALQLKISAMKFQLIEHLCFTIYEYIKASLPKDAHLTVTTTKYPRIEGLTCGVSFSYGDKA